MMKNLRYRFFEDKKGQTEQDMLQKELYLPPFISFDEMRAIPAFQVLTIVSRLPMISQHATTGQVQPARRGRPKAYGLPDSDRQHNVAQKGRKATGLSSGQAAGRAATARQAGQRAPEWNYDR